MTDQDQTFDPQKGRRERDDTPQGDVALGTDGQDAPQNTSDSPTEGSVPGPLAPQPAPDTETVAPHPENN